MKIPEYLRQPVFAPGCYSIGTVAKILRIEATIIRQQGWVEGGRALKQAADSLERIGTETSPAEAFDWPVSVVTAETEPK